MSKYVKLSEMDEHQRGLYEQKKKRMEEKRRASGIQERRKGKAPRKKKVKETESVFVADFETTTEEWYNKKGYTEVWAWAITNVHPTQAEPLAMDDTAVVATNRIKETTCYGDKHFLETQTPIESFFWELTRGTYKDNCKIYFHNLKFDGSFLLNYLLTENYYDASAYMYGVLTPEEVENEQGHRKKMPIRSFALLGDTSVWYSLKVNLEGKTIEFRDSLKRIPMTVRQMAIEYNLPILKGEIDYTRNPDDPITEEEEKYIRHDVLIVAEVLRQQYREGFTELTTASFSYNNYKRYLKDRDIDIKDVFGNLSKDCSHFARKSYEGGEVWVNPDYQGQFLGDPYSDQILGYTWDINSMYPAVYSCMPMPYGSPLSLYDVSLLPYIDYYNVNTLREWRGTDKRYFIEVIHCKAILKENHIPSISVTIGFNKRIFPEEIEINDKVFADVRYELLLEDYDIEEIELGRIDIYNARQDLFFDYVKQIVDEKNRASIEGNKMRKALAKVKMNSLYGKFAQKEEMISATFVLNADGELESRHFVSLSEIRYVPLASIITAEARYLLITQARKFGYDNVVYMDTDSIHTLAGHDCISWRRRPLPENKEEKFLQMSSSLSCDELYNKLKEFEYGHPKEIWCDEYDLGAFKIESKYAVGKWLRAKTYFEGNPISKEDADKYLALDEKDKDGDFIIKGKDFLIKGCIKGAGIPDVSKNQITVDNFDFGLVLKGKLLPCRVRGGVVLKESEYEIKEEMTVTKIIDKVDDV